MLSLTSFVMVAVVLLLSDKVYGDEQQESCSRRCGVHNISHPFRLKDSPKKCGDNRYNLSCEDNNQLILYHGSFGKYYVQSINYNNFTIQLSYFNILSNNSIPPSDFSPFFTSNIYVPYLEKNNSLSNRLTKLMLHVSCPNQAGYIYRDNCRNSSLYSRYENSFYVDGYFKTLSELGLRDGCRIELMFLTSWSPQDGNNNNISCTDINRMMSYGFEVSWLNSLCKDDWHAEFDQNNHLHCRRPVFRFSGWEVIIEDTLILGVWVTSVGFLFSIVKFVLGAPCIIVLLIYKCRREHLSVYDGIEDFLRSDNSIMPIRYSYKDIKKITEQFKTKLGNGGYGTVFKGQLRSGCLVAVKLLDKAKSNGQDFINEVVTIGRIHHVNVVHLIGFCVEGSKRVLIYEFMPNGSLEKYIFSHNEESNSLSCEKLHAISLGVARGIEYLHNGCDITTPKKGFNSTFFAL
ncbi:wall-associated receptor kinase galacturonan-binding protein [Medicago truncatula]|uniref:Wall-associated receptor kinase galacturonan-binding protein n=2 Tax=Medicago truncatula TaxID=3880 RepID=G7I970_MEDTR|nr:wall-associated receptor kinase galacturonan-binding protein [Medicago truncatula]